jgi:hypothetical protein
MAGGPDLIVKLAINWASGLDGASGHELAEAIGEKYIWHGGVC